MPVEMKIKLRSGYIKARHVSWWARVWPWSWWRRLQRNFKRMPKPVPVALFVIPYEEQDNEHQTRARVVDVVSLEEDGGKR